MTAVTDAALLRLDGREVRVTTPGRVLWPATGTTKLDLVRYLVDASPAILPHIAGRGLTMRRFPEGVGGKSWFQAECRGRPDWMATQDVDGAGGTRYHYCRVDDTAGLAWLASMGSLELHPFLAPAADPLAPTMLVLDLDPSPPAGLLDAAAVALAARAILVAAGVPASVKVSGARGIHVLVGLAAGQSFATTKAVARRIGQRLEREHPGLVTARLGRRAARQGQVLVDWLQNDPSRSTVAAWSPRAMPVPLVAAPVTWAELEAAVLDGRPSALRFGFDAALARIAEGPDPLAPLLDPSRGVVLPPPEAFGPQ